MKLYELANKYHIGTDLACAEAMFKACNEYYQLNLSEETRKMFSVMGVEFFMKATTKCLLVCCRERWRTQNSGAFCETTSIFAVRKRKWQRVLLFTKMLPNDLEIK